jgi:hypothetical protein
MFDKKKRAEWEEKTGKKWLPKDEYKKKMNKKYGEKKEKKSADDSDEGGFTLMAEPLELESAYSNRNSILHHDDFLADSGATVYITPDRSRFDDYTEVGTFPLVRTMGGVVKPQGKGTVLLRYPLANGKIRILTLCDVLYVPNGGANLFSGKKLLEKGGVIRNDDFDDPQGKQLCQLNDLYILEERQPHQGSRQRIRLPPCKSNGHKESDCLNTTSSLPHDQY